jgi:hypothetical protein
MPPVPLGLRYISSDRLDEGVEMNSVFTSTTAGARASVPSAAHTTSTSTAKRAHKHAAWPTATKSAFYANFYAVVEATGALVE